MCNYTVITGNSDISLYISEKIVREKAVFVNENGIFYQIRSQFISCAHIKKNSRTKNIIEIPRIMQKHYLLLQFCYYSYQLQFAITITSYIVTEQSISFISQKKVHDIVKHLSVVENYMIRITIHFKENQFQLLFFIFAKIV